MVLNRRKWNKQRDIRNNKKATGFLKQPLVNVWIGFHMDRLNIMNHKLSYNEAWWNFCIDLFAFGISSSAEPSIGEATISNP